MTDRTFIGATHPEILELMQAFPPALERAAEQAGLPAQLLELVYNRVSQINACAACLNAHHRAGVEAGLTEQRIALLPAWRDSNLYDEAEKAALELAEAVTRVAFGHMADEDYDRVVAVLGEEGAAVVQWAATSMNMSNRVYLMGKFQPAKRS